MQAQRKSGWWLVVIAVVALCGVSACQQESKCSKCAEREKPQSFTGQINSYENGGDNGHAPPSDKLDIKGLY